MDSVHQVRIAALRLRKAQRIKALGNAVDDLPVGQVGAAVLHRRDQAGLSDHEAQAHGAVLMAHGYDTIELSIARPISRRDEAMQMAEIHHKYCPDNIQSAGTFEEYAASLIGSTTWSFWWD